MSPAECAKSVDAATRSGDAAAFLDSVRRAFEDSDRRGDPAMAAMMRGLIRDGEIETVLVTRAQRRGRCSTGEPGSTT